MEPINKNGYEEKPIQKSMVSAVEKSSSAKKRITRSLLNNTGLFVAVFLIFVVIVVFTTDVNITSFEFWAQLGLTFFILLFCSYSMYINCSDSGMKAGKESEQYNDTKKCYEQIKAEIVKKQYQSRMCEFCRHYIDQELEQTRINILTEVGISYTKYMNIYIGKDKERLQRIKELSKSQIAAIDKANKTKPISLTPEMIFKRGRGGGNRNPLGTKPETKRHINYAVKFVWTFATSILTGVIVLEVVETPTWATFAACCLKLLPVILNGVMGYRMGYENITIDTVNYTSDQIDIMQQFIQYAENTPEQTEESEVTNSNDEKSTEQAEPILEKAHQSA